MKRCELMMTLGKTMERLNIDDQLIKGLGLEFKVTMIDTMSDEIVLNEKETMDLLSGLMGEEPKYVLYWVGVAIKTLAMTSR